MRKKILCSLMLIASFGGLGWADEPQQQSNFEVTAVVVKSDGDETQRLQITQATPSKLWLGVGLKSVEGDLSDFLGSNDGVLIEDVHENSPASKAGIMKGDVLLSVNETKLEGPSDLLEFMKTAKAGQELTLKVRRKNEELTVQVTPADRPKELTMSFDLSQQIGEGAKPFLFDPSRMEMFRMGNPTGIFVPQGLPEGDLQLNLNQSINGKSIDVEIVRKSGKPAEVIVTKDGETKTYSEERLDELPEDIRGWVSSMLKPGGRAIVSMGEIGDLSQLQGFLPDTNHLQSHLESLMKNGAFPKAAQEAIEQALKGVAAGAEKAQSSAQALNSSELRKQLDEIRNRMTTEANEAVAKAAKGAKKAMIEAEKSAQKATQSAKIDNQEVAELRQLVDELKKEIAELRAANKKDKANN